MLPEFLFVVFTIFFFMNSYQNIYPIHEDIYTTEFWIGEEPKEDNSYIDNYDSAWDELWYEHYLEGKENSFYCALPFNEFDDIGKKETSILKRIYWINDFPFNALNENDDTPLLKNRWIKIMYKNKTAYCQWEDTGPYYEDDINYVFGNSRPKAEINNYRHKVGLDVSPSVQDYLGLTGYNKTSWQFIDEKNVPSGPWKETITNSQIYWE